MFALLSALISAALPQAAQRPNIVLILADDLGYGDVGCYGATKISTPQMDRLAREGMRFTDAHSPHSVCTPTRYSLLTGRYAWRSWAGSGTVWANDPLLIEPGRETIASLLQSTGYETACVGKWHLGFGAPGQAGWDDLRGPDYNQALKPGPLEVGFDSFFGVPQVGQLPHFYLRDHHVVGLDNLEKPIRLVLDPKPEFHQPYLKRSRHEAKTPWHTFENTEPIQYTEEEVAVRLTEEAVRWIDQRDGRQPFFLYFPHRNPHVPWKPHPQFVGSSDAGNYGDFIHEFDWSVGQVLAALDRNGMTSNTLVILSSDNGACNYRKTDRLVIHGHKADGELRGQKTEVYEGGHRVPLLVRWPRVVEPGSNSDRLTALTDLFATFAEMLNHPRAEAGEDSFSFLAALTGKLSTWPARTTLVSDSFRNLLAIREGPWKLIPFQGGGGIGWQNEVDPRQPAGQLYHLGDDVGETTNRYEDEPEKVAHLTALLQACVESAGEPVNLMETIPSGGSPKPAERALVVAFADRVNHVEAIYGARGSVTHLEISNHAMWIERHRLGEARPGLTDAEFHRIAELPSLESLQILQQPLSDDAYAVLARIPRLKAFRIEGHRTDQAAGGSHRFMLHINHCLNLEALELKHLFGLRGTSVAKIGPMPKLKYLELDNDSAGPEALAFLEGCPNLRDFELHRTSMNDEQIGRVVDLLPKLKRFVIKPGSPRLTASSLRHLQRCNELKVVGLHQWKRPGSLPWDDGLNHLLSVPTLEMVEFPGSYVTAGSDELQRLRQARPHLEFKALDP